MLRSNGLRIEFRVEISVRESVLMLLMLLMLLSKESVDRLELNTAKFTIDVLMPTMVLV